MLRHCHRSAFTLLEMVVVLALVGMMAAFLVKLAPTRDCYAETRAQQREIRAALETYVRNNNHYPMPAGRALGINNPLFGVAVTDPASTLIDRIGTDPATNVLAGALPATTLGLNIGYATDCWGNKFTYYVSEQLTTSATYMSNTSAGHITIRNGTLAAPSTLTASAAYAVISHGKDALGASARNNSASKKYCSGEQANGTITRIDKENCDIVNKEIYASSFNNGDTPANFFDDVVIYANKTGYTGCNAASITWGTGNTCTANVPATSHSDTLSVNNTSGGYIGSATVTCTNGTITLGATSCSAVSPGACSSQSVTWLTNCVATAPTLNNGQSMSVSSTASGYAGSVTVTCNSGTLSQASPTCGTGYTWVYTGGGGPMGASYCSTPAGSSCTTQNSICRIANSPGGCTGDGCDKMTCM